MNSNDYYEISQRLNLPLRCPILNYCERRAATIYINSGYIKVDPTLSIDEALTRDGTLPEDFTKNKICIQGQAPTFIGGTNNYLLTGMCPEVNLFESSHSQIQDEACVSVEYDKYYKAPQKRVLKSQHFSECPEFNKYLFEKGKSHLKFKTQRRTVSLKIRSKLQKEIDSICPFCSSPDVEHFQVHHIDENRTNNEISNLLLLCPTCHSKITKGDISRLEVEQIKKHLQG